ncbi:MAG: ABC transporter permease [Gemmatimonas sp.]
MSLLEVAGRAMRRVKFLFGKRSAERDMNEEMRIHLEFEIDDRMRQGMTPAEARRTAFVDFGGVERFKEEARDARGVRSLEDLAYDLRYAARVLRRSPIFSLTSIVTTSVGVAAVTMVFSVLNAVVLKSLPAFEADRLVSIAEVWANGMRSTQTDMNQFMYPYTHFLELRQASAPALLGMAGYRFGNVALREANNTHPVSAMAVSRNFFAVLGLRPAVGQLFSDTAEVGSTPAPEVVISYDLWQRDYRSNAAAVGTTLYIDGRALNVTGVAPRGFRGPIIGLAADVWVPTATGTITMFGRLRPNATREQARLALSAVARALPAEDAGRKVVKMTFDPMALVPAASRSAVVGSMGVFMLMASLVMLIVATNIGGMFFARAAYRRREMAVRLSLGATRGRVMRQLLTESVALSIVGGIAGVIVAQLMLRAVQSVELPVPFKIVLDFNVDVRVFALSFLVALTSGVVAGVVPAWQSARLDVQSGLRNGAGAARDKAGLARNSFVVLQLAFSIVLLVTAGLFTRALYRAAHVETGLDVSGVMIGEIGLQRRVYDTERGRQFFARLSSQLATRTEIESSALAQFTPLAFGRNSEDVKRPDGGRESVTYGVADANYAATMRIPLMAGRMFSDIDVQNSTPVTVVNETLARRLWPGKNPIGQFLPLNGDREVIGVVRDGKYRELDEAPRSYAFLPVSQRYSPRLTVHVRARGDRAAALRALREEVAKLDPDIAVEKTGALSVEIASHYLPQRIAAWSLGVLGLFGLALAAFGIYGVIAYQVAQRSHEFGIRLALGARKADITNSVLRVSVRIMLLSVLIGTSLAIAVARLAQSYIYGVGATDATTFAAVIILFAGVVLLAGYIPARRAARVDPMVSLRME